jgi:hypothetical protein
MSALINPLQLILNICRNAYLWNNGPKSGKNSPNFFLELFCNVCFVRNPFQLILNIYRNAYSVILIPVALQKMCRFLCYLIGSRKLLFKLTKIEHKIVQSSRCGVKQKIPGVWGKG